MRHIPLGLGERQRGGGAGGGGLQEGELGLRSRGEGRRRRNEARRGRRRRWSVGVGPSGVDGVVVGGYLECEEAECEGDKQGEAEKCGGEGEAGEMGDGVAN